jgi:signal transduction histidine kinase
MSPLPLKAKISLWSALAAALALVAAAVGIEVFSRAELMEAIDQRMDKEVQEIWWDLDRLEGGPVENRLEITEDLMPPSLLLMNRLIEIYGKDKKLMWRSPNLKNQTLAGGPPEPHEVKFSDRHQPFRVGTYYYKYLTLHFGVPLGNYYGTLKRIRDAIIVVFPIVVLLSLGGGCWVAWLALKPVRQITNSARRITAEDLHRRLPMPRAKDEISELTEVLNHAITRLEKSYNQAIHFASDASHQLKTPITVMRAAIEDVLHDPTLKPEHYSAIADLLQQTRRLSSLTDGLLLLARADAGRLSVKLAETDLTQVVQGCVEDAEIIAATHDINIEMDLPDAIPAFADPLRTEQILLNLLENAVKYNRPGGTIRLRAETDGLGTSITVCNTGRPIPVAKMEHVFDRFVRGEANEERSGHGLGLALARELARAQGGELTLVRSDHQWTEFELRLRASLKVVAAEPPALVATS